MVDIVLSGEQSHVCTKKDCHYCDIMNRPIRDDIPFRKNGWSNNEITFLQNNYAIMKTEEIQTVINKSQTAIWFKAHKLKLKKNQQLLLTQ